LYLDFFKTTETDEINCAVLSYQKILIEIDYLSFQHLVIIGEESSGSSFLPIAKALSVHLQKDFIFLEEINEEPLKPILDLAGESPFIFVENFEKIKSFYRFDVFLKSLTQDLSVFILATGNICPQDHSSLLLWDCLIPSKSFLTLALEKDIAYINKFKNRLSSKRGIMYAGPVTPDSIEWLLIVLKQINILGLLGEIGGLMKTLFTGVDCSVKFSEQQKEWGRLLLFHLKEGQVQLIFDLDEIISKQTLFKNGLFFLQNVHDDSLWLTEQQETFLNACSSEGNEEISLVSTNLKDMVCMDRGIKGLSLGYSCFPLLSGKYTPFLSPFSIKNSNNA